MIELVIGLVIGAGVGAWGYRYLLKRDPEALERLAAQARAMGNRLK